MERLITKRQEEIYRCRHHDFMGLTTEETATKLGISTHTVRAHLTTLKKIAPQLFPILSKENARIWRLWHENGLSCREIASRMRTTERAVIERLRRIKKNMNYHEVVMANPHRAISLNTLDVDTVIVKQ